MTAVRVLLAIAAFAGVVAIGVIVHRLRRPKERWVEPEVRRNVFADAIADRGVADGQKPESRIPLGWGEP